MNTPLVQTLNKISKNKYTVCIIQYIMDSEIYGKLGVIEMRPSTQLGATEVPPNNIFSRGKNTMPIQYSCHTDKMCADLLLWTFLVVFMCKANL